MAAAVAAAVAVAVVAAGVANVSFGTVVAVVEAESFADSVVAVAVVEVEPAAETAASFEVAARESD